MNQIEDHKQNRFGHLMIDAWNLRSVICDFGTKPDGIKD